MKNNADRIKKINEDLRVIERTRLLYNSHAELGELVGFSIDAGNSLTRKGGKSLFMKDAIFRELAYIAKDAYGLDLEEVIEAYRIADDVVECHRSLLKNKDICAYTIRHFYKGDPLPESYRMALKRLERSVVPIFVLLVLGLLPRLNAKGGDVKDILKDYKKLFAVLKPIIKSDILLDVLPVFATIEGDVLSGRSELSRLHLIHITWVILKSYGDLSGSEQMFACQKELPTKMLNLPIDGIWVENEGSTVFWNIERVIKGYFLYRYAVNYERKKVKRQRYGIYFYDFDDMVIATVLHPQMMRFQILGRQIPHQYISYLKCSVDGDIMTFQPLNEESKWPKLKTLRRSAKHDELERLMEDDSFTVVNEFEEYEYDFMISLAAITEEYVYVFSPEGGYYKVPKSLDDLLKEVTFDSVVGVMAYPDVLYVAFDDLLLYFDVTTEESRKLKGIALVDVIDV